MNKFLVLFFVSTFCVSAFANDDEKRAKAKASMEEGKSLLVPELDTSFAIRDADRMGRARDAFRQAFAELCAIDEANRTEQDLRNIYFAAMHFAGRDQVKPPVCVLCLKGKKFCGSHVIPNGVLSRLTSDVDATGKVLKPDGGIIQSSRPNHDAAAASVTWPLFCKPGCEDIFSDMGENKFANYFWLFAKRLQAARASDPVVSAQYMEKAGESTTLFCVASIVFRYMLVNGLSDIKSAAREHGTSVITAFWRLFFILRDYMLDPSHAPAPHMQLFFSQEDVGQRSMINVLSINPSTDAAPCYVNGHFEWGGCHFVVTQSADQRLHHPEDYLLPQAAFQGQVDARVAPNRFTLLVGANDLLTLPPIATRARVIDSATWKDLFSRISPEVDAHGKPVSIRLPSHPLAKQLMTPPRHVFRLADDMKIERDRKTGKPDLRLMDPNKNFVFAHSDYAFGIDTCDAWLCKNLRAKENAFRAVLCRGNIDRSCSFGYQLPAHLFESDLRAAANAALEQCCLDNVEPIEAFLKANPLAGTTHAEIEPVTRAYDTYMMLLDLLTGWWEKLAAPLRVDNIYIADLEERQVRFRERQVPKDNDCGFHVLGITRAQGIRLLLANVNNERIRDMVAHDIFAAFINNDLPQVLGVESVKRYRELYDVLTDQIHRLEAQIRRAFDADAQNQLREHYRSRNELLKKIQDWARRPGVFHHFVTEYLGTQGQWLTYVRDQTGLLDALAHLLNLDVAVWIPDPLNARRVTLNHFAGEIGAPNNRRLINVIHTDALTHFNLLEEEHELYNAPIAPLAFGRSY